VAGDDVVDRASRRRLDTLEVSADDDSADADSYQFSSTSLDHGCARAEHDKKIDARAN